MDQTVNDSIESKRTFVAGAEMTPAEAVKVYELAKELGMDSIGLIEKLKALHIEVKSHMSSLSADDVRIVREHLAPKTKKASKKASGSAEKKATTVIRRRARSDTAEATQVTGTATELPSEAALPEISEGETAEQHQEKSEALTSTVTAEQAIDKEVSPQTSAPVASSEPTIVTRPRSTIIITKKAEPPAPAQSAQKTLSKPSRPVASQPPASPTFSTSVSSGLKMTTLLGAKSAGQTARPTSSLIKIVKEEPLKKIEKPLAPVAKPKTGTSVGSGIVNLGKEAIDRLVEEEQAFKKKAGPGRGEREKETVDVNFSQYRAKKELVFLPKKKKVPVNKEVKQTEITKPAAHKRVIRIEDAVTVVELAQRMGVKNNLVMQKLIAMGSMATLNQPIDLDTATLIATEYGFEVENIAFKEESVLKPIEDKPETLLPRPPIVTVMGHVDHGKTSLLDAIRSTNVAAGEAGGITQHIGAYTVEVNGKQISFIDTPGHEAFTMMRARGANVTDIVILVVAADDGVMPQTREAIDHARAANVPIIVAVNKIDKPGANPDKVLKGLSEYNLLPEAWGGDTIFVNVSALKKTGINELLESILLQAEMLDLKANPERLAEGVVLEARLDRARGAVVNILVRKGTLRVGDSVVAGQVCGRVRALMDDKGSQLKAIGPGFAAELLGLEAVPVAGEPLNAVESEAAARDLVSHRQEKLKGIDAGKPKLTLEELFSKTQQGEVKELPIILKSDVVGSTEAIRDSLGKIATDKVKVKVIHASTGGITESDVMLATASSAIILGFNVRPDTKARAIAERESIEIKTYTIIYELLDDVKKAMSGVLEKKAVERYQGRAEVRELFTIPKVGVIAGSFVIDGKITRGSQVRVLRDNRVIYTGKLSSLKRFKDDAKEVAQGYECGIGVENFNDIKVGDQFEAFIIEMVAQDLGSATPQPVAAASN